MAGSFSLASDIRVFSCPNCRETINTSMTTCPFCHTAIDAGTAELAAAEMSRISKACSSASYLAGVGGAYGGYFALRCILSYMSHRHGDRFFYFLALSAPLMVIPWWVKYGFLQTDDADFPRAKRTVLSASLGTIAAFVLGVVGILFF